MPGHDWKNTKLLCVSPHKLLDNDGKLRIKVCDAPGAGTFAQMLEDEVYMGRNRHPASGTGWEAEWNADQGDFRVNLLWGTRDDVEEVCLRGESIQPTPIVPERVSAQDPSFAIMNDTGTVFELKLPEDLQEGQCYTIRLRVDPTMLLNLTKPNPEDDAWLRFMDIPSGQLTQDLNIFAPSTCLFNIRENLEVLRSDPYFSVAAGVLQTTISNGVTLLPLELHRIVVVCPREGEFSSHHVEGFASHAGTYRLSVFGGDDRDEAVKYCANEWISGSRTYWVDDPGQLARRVWDQLHGWGPKTKEELTASLQREMNPSHLKVSLVASVLYEIKAIDQKSVPGPLGDRLEYRASDLSLQELDSKIEELIRNPEIVKGFTPRGFEISYTVTYPYLSGESKNKLRKAKLREEWTFLLAMLGVTFSLIGLVIGVLALVLFLLYP